MSYLMRIDPYRGLSRMQREMDRLMRGFFGPVLPEEEAETIRVPSVDVSETEHEVLVKAEVPGITKEDLDIEVTPEALHLRGEVKHEREEGGKEATYHRRELVWQRFERTIPLPTEVKTEGVTAKLENGLLEVHLPKEEETRAKTHKVEIQ